MCGFLGLKELCNEVWAVEVLLWLPGVIFAAIKDNSLVVHTGSLLQLSLPKKVLHTRSRGDAERSSSLDAGVLAPRHRTLPESGQGSHFPSQERNAIDFIRLPVSH